MSGTGSVKVGVFGIGLDTYWPQFAGLRDRLTGYLARVENRLRALGAEIVCEGLVDSVEKSREAGSCFRREEVDLIFLYITTYALSSTVLPVVQRAGVPVVVLNLQPVSQLDYQAFNAMGDRGRMTGEWLAHCQSCTAPELACAFNRTRIPFHLVSGTLEGEDTWREIGEWIDAARIVRGMRDNRVGVLGHYYCGMLDVYSDMTQQAGVLGCHFELLEMCELHALREGASGAEVDAMVRRFHEEFEVSPECEQAELIRAARTSVALHKLVECHQLGSLAYYYESQPGYPYEDIVTSVIAGNSLLTAHGVPVAGECEIKNIQAMKMLDLIGAGGSFAEPYLMDYDDDVILLGHDGPGHMAIAEGRVKLVPLPVYHGKPGRGLSIQMSVKHGPATVLSLVQDGEGRLKLLVAEGESVPGPVLEIGNTNSRYRFTIGAKAFFDAWCLAGPAHHMAIGTGHVAGVLEKAARLLGIAAVRVC